MQMIEVTVYGDDTKMLINPAMITSISKCEAGGTWIFFTGEDDGLRVSNGVDDILSLLDGVRDSPSGMSGLGLEELLSRIPTLEQIESMLASNARQRNAILHLEKVVESLQSIPDGDE